MIGRTSRWAIRCAVTTVVHGPGLYWGVVERQQTSPNRYKNICLKVRQERDAMGNPIRKGMRRTVMYNVHYFEKVNEEDDE